MGFPKSSHFNRVFHYFHHPFWGTPIFGNTHIAKPWWPLLERHLWGLPGDGAAMARLRYQLPGEMSRLTEVPLFEGWKHFKEPVWSDMCLSYFVPINIRTIRNHQKIKQFTFSQPFHMKCWGQQSFAAMLSFMCSLNFPPRNMTRQNVSHGFSMAFPMHLKAFGKKTDPFELGEAANSAWSARHQYQICMPGEGICSRSFYKYLHSPTLKDIVSASKAIDHLEHNGWEKERLHPPKS